MKYVFTLLFTLGLMTSSSAFTKDITINNWEVRCTKSCVLGQGVAKEGSASSRFGLVISHPESSTEPVMQINTPLGIYLPSGLGFELGDIQQDVPLITCLPNGCRAIIILNEKIRNAMNVHEELNIRFYTNDNVVRSISFPLQGFAMAFEHAFSK